MIDVATLIIILGIVLFGIGLRNAMSKAKLSPIQIFIRVVLGIGLLMVVFFALVVDLNNDKTGDSAVKGDVKNLVTSAVANSIDDSLPPSAPWRPGRSEQSEPLLICNGKKGEGTKVNVRGQGSFVRMAFTPKCSDNSLVYGQDMGTEFRAAGIRINGTAVYYSGTIEYGVNRSPCASTPCTYADALLVLNSVKMEENDRKGPRLPAASSSPRK